MADKDPVEHAVKTWRYLRLGMIMLVVGLLIAILVERDAVGWRCWQRSVSGYYYTPARGFFVAAVLAVGVCLVALKATRDSEDILLNLAGMFAPIVALVPTPPGKTPPGEKPCTSFPYDLDDRTVNIENNVKALLVVGAVALLLVVALTAWDWFCHRTRPGCGSVVGLLVALALWALALDAFYAHREWFLKNAHNYAAIAMFVCIFLVVLINAADFGRKRRTEKRGKRVFANRYLAVAFTMAVAAAVTYQKHETWDHAVLGIEAAMIALFALFWVFQTWELWRQGLRGLPAQPNPCGPPPAPPDPPAPQAPPAVA